MQGLISSLKEELLLKNFNLRKRVKITKKGKESLCYQLEFYSESANKILNFLYSSLNKDDLFLKRKYEKFLEAKNLFSEQEKRKSFGRVEFRLTNNYKKGLRETIETFLFEDKMIPREIALKLGISLSTLYRWMDKYGIRKFVPRGSKEWSQRVIKSRLMRLR